MYEIKKGVPLPSGRDTYKYPFSSMEPGDSFDVSLEENITNRNKFNSVCACSQRYAKKHNKKFTTKLISSNILRVWRIE